MGVVIAEMHAMMRLPPEAMQRRPFPVQAEHHRVVPHQNVDVQTAATAHQLVQELAELELRPVVPGAEQTRTAVEIPACDENRAARVASGGYESPEIGVGV